jgi:hypothetical protein
MLISVLTPTAASFAVLATPCRITGACASQAWRIGSLLPTVKCVLFASASLPQSKHVGGFAALFRRAGDFFFGTATSAPLVDCPWRRQPSHEPHTACR